MSLVTTPAVLLRSFAYGETSRILRFFTREHGVVGVMARGVRKNGARGGTGLDTFTGGTLTVYMKPTRDLQTLKEFTPAAPRSGLGRDVLRFAGASLAAELVLRHAGEEANPLLFEALGGALDRLDAIAPDHVLPTVLSEAWRLVAVLGYEPVLERCVQCERRLGEDAVARFDFAAGGVRCPACSEGPGGPRVGPEARAQLRAFLRGEHVAPLRRARAHFRLLSDFITYHVSGSRPLDTFDFLDSVLPEDA